MNQRNNHLITFIWGMLRAVLHVCVMVKTYVRGVVESFREHSLPA